MKQQPLLSIVLFHFTYASIHMLHTKVIVYIKLLTQNKKKCKNLKKHRYMLNTVTYNCPFSLRSELFNNKNACLQNVCINLNLYTIRFFSLNYLYNLQNNSQKIDPTEKNYCFKTTKTKTKQIQNIPPPSHLANLPVTPLNLIFQVDLNFFLLTLLLALLVSMGIRLH